VAVDAPSAVGADRLGDGSREVLPSLAHRGRDHDAVGRDPAQRPGKGALAARVSGRACHAPAAREVEDDDEVHVDPNRDGGVAPGQPARGDDHVMDGAHPEAAQLVGHRGGEIPRVPQRVDALERVAAVAVVGGRPAGEVLREPLSGRHERPAGGGLGGELHRHG
jgi:hypothetical protein